MNFTEEEHWHVMEEEYGLCRYRRESGSKRWPVLCAKDLKYAKKDQCDKCHEKRKQRGL